MSAKIEITGSKVSITITVDLTGSMMEMEDKIQEELNEAGCGLTKEALRKFDTNGQPLKIGGTRYTAQQKSLKEYQTPYGPVAFSRYVYQTSKGGEIYCPLDDYARIITSSTPRFAQIVSSKYVNHGSASVKRDLEASNGRVVSRCYIQDLAETVGAMAGAVEETLDYKIPPLKEEVAIISFSLDGTCMYMKGDGYREAMAGTLALYSAAGDRLHTIYLGAAPEYGKETFLTKLESEIQKIKARFPGAIYVGIADGAKSNWAFLDKHATIKILDFYHATEYLTDAADAFGKNPGERKVWLDNACHRLKHDIGGAKALLREMKKTRSILDYHVKSTPILQEKLDKAITYFTNQQSRMNYRKYRDQNLPIGSGVTEAACKTLIKQRLCNSGMKWKHDGAQMVISLRAMHQTDGRWNQFWDRIDAQGLAGVLLT